MVTRKGAFSPEFTRMAVVFSEICVLSLAVRRTAGAGAPRAGAPTGGGGCYARVPRPRRRLHRPANAARKKGGITHGTEGTRHPELPPVDRSGAGGGGREGISC